MTPLNDDSDKTVLMRLEPIRQGVRLYHLTPRTFDRFELIGGAPGLHLALDQSGFDSVRALYQRFRGRGFTVLECRLEANGLFVRTVDLQNWSSTALYLAASQAGAVPMAAWLEVHAGVVSALCDTHSWSTLSDILELRGAPIVEDERAPSDALKEQWSRDGWFDALLDRDQTVLNEMLLGLRAACPVLSGQLDLFFLPGEFLESVRLDLSARMLKGGFAGFAYQSVHGGGQAILVLDPSAVTIVASRPD